MKYHTIGYLAVGFVLGAVMWGFLGGTALKGVRAAKQPPCIGCSVDGKTTPRTPDGHPNLSGHWGGGGGDHDQYNRSADGSFLYDFSGKDLDENGDPISAVKATAPKPGQTSFNIGSDKPEDNAPYKPEYFAQAQKIGDQVYGASNSDDPQFACKPGGVPRAAFGEMQIVSDPGVIAILYSEPMNDRLIYTDGRQHPKHLDTSYMGDSIGRWDGDTLVVDVAGLNDETWLAGGFSAPKYTNIHSDQEHVIERWTREGDTLTYQATVDDPVMFTKPWALKPRKIRHAGPDPGNDNSLMQFGCSPTDLGHIIKPTKDDQYYCNLCIQPGGVK